MNEEKKPRRLCARPPGGWWCSREVDDSGHHDGPCAVRQVGPIRAFEGRISAMTFEDGVTQHLSSIVVREEPTPEMKESVMGSSPLFHAMLTQARGEDAEASGVLLGRRVRVHTMIELLPEES